MPKDDAKPKRKAEKGHKKKDGRKRALWAYNFFSKEWREKIKTDNPDASFGEIGKLLGDKWKELDPAEKMAYEQAAAQAKGRDQRARAEIDHLEPGR